MVILQRYIYSISLSFYSLLLWLLSPLIKKAKLWVNGRKDLFLKIETSLAKNTAPLVWFHAASLGEFEQARPVIEACKNKYPKHKVLLTFFSPSGYNVQKNYEHADFVFYLPLDSKKNALKFIKLTQPIIAFFVKYEFWHYYIEACKKQNIPTISFSTILRPNQHYFKWHGKFYRNILRNITAFFTQNEETKVLLGNIGIDSMLAGDTRCDRVRQIAKKSEDFPLISSFVDNVKTVVIGSAWPQDMKLIIPFINKYPEYKYIIAPHEINIESINNERKNIRSKSELYSNLTSKTTANVLYIDSIGILSKIYRYATVSYVGGGFGSGLHNILEPASFGTPLLFGIKYNKFQEANDLVKLEAAFSVENAHELEIELQHLLTDKEYLKRKSDTCVHYIEKQSGATDKIIQYIDRIL